VACGTPSSSDSGRTRRGRPAVGDEASDAVWPESSSNGVLELEPAPGVQLEPRLPRSARPQAARWPAPHDGERHAEQPPLDPPSCRLRDLQPRQPRFAATIPSRYASSRASRTCQTARSKAIPTAVTARLHPRGPAWGAMAASRIKRSPRASGYAGCGSCTRPAKLAHVAPCRGAGPGSWGRRGRNRDTGQPVAPRGLPAAALGRRAGQRRASDPGRCRAGPSTRSRAPGNGSPSLAPDRRRSQRRHCLLGTGRFCDARRRSCSRKPLRKACTTPRGSPRASATATWTWRGQAPPFAALSFSRSCRIASA
jgi:hypothetical protein